jgi:hypothetical protein
MADAFDRMQNALEWLKTPPGLHFQREIMGMTGSERNHKPLAAALSKIFRYWEGSFPLSKDLDENELRCEPLREFLQGQDVDHERLATAIVMMMQAFDAACDANYSMKQAFERMRRQPRYPHRPMMPR